MTVPFGRYQLLRRLGRGGMGEVFLAERRVGGVEKRLVIKRIHRARAADPRFLAMFMREAQLSMALAHGSIVQVFDFGRVQADVFLAMEYVEGVDLATAMAAAPERCVPPLVAAFIAAECCRALDHAHRRKDPSGAPLGIVHRDVSPRNLLLSDAGEVKLADFGIAVVVGDGDGRTRGTPAYMAPEQARGERVDARSDVYALGLVLREMLTGVRARQGDVLGLAASGELPALADDVPLHAVIARATQPDASARYADARELGADLERYLVTERAKTPGPAPDVMLADWLAKVAPERATGEAVDGAGVAEVLTFADDGADAVGATQRSGAATVDGPAGDVAPPGDARVADLAAQIADDAIEIPAVDSPAIDATPPRSRVPWLAAVAAGLGLVAVVVAHPWRDDPPPPEIRPASTEASLTVDIGQTKPDIGQTKPDIGQTKPDIGQTKPDTHETKPDTHQVKPDPHQAKPDIRQTKPDIGQTKPDIRQTKPDPRPSPPDAPAVTQRVTIGAKPWATFTIDADATVHQTPDTVALSAGPHLVHFSNPTLHVTRDVTLQVGASELRHVEDLSR